MQCSRRVTQIVETSTKPYAIRRQPRHQPENLVKLSLRIDMHDPDLQIRPKPPCRIHVAAAQLRFDLRQRLHTQGGNLRGDDHERTTGRQPQTTSCLRQAPAINGSPLKQRINQERTLSYVSQ